MKKFIFLLVVALNLVPLSSLLAVTAEQAEREVLVYIATDTTIIIPPPSISATVAQADINFQPLADTLANHPVEVIEKAVPSFNRADTVAYDENGEPVKLLDLSRLFRVRLLPGNSPDSLAAHLNSLGGEIIYAHSNGKTKPLALIPNDQFFGSQWGLLNTGQIGGKPGEDIKATEAWETTTGNSNSKIAIIDGGMDPDHDDFLNRFLRTENLPDGHGTQVGGIAAATGNNAIGVAGVNWQAKIISEDIFHGQPGADDVDIYNAIVDAVQNWGAEVLNNSYGKSEYSLTQRSAFSFAYKMNRVMVAAAGNNDTSGIVHFPAAFAQGVIAVGATNRFGNRATFSSVGNWVNVAAPGEDILSTIPGDNYAPNDGTSFAAPFATGLASLLKGFKPVLSNDDIDNIIKWTADDKVGGPDNLPPGWDPQTGYGLINAKRAFDVLQPPTCSSG
ncbi:MAG: S8 family serine peptidase [candidate division Zixibacteria bacterium]|nr:S8 family serine peptidase [candidate division Zixibacteria bacterium]